VIRDHLLDATLGIAPGAEQVVPRILQVAAVKIELGFSQLDLSLGRAGCLRAAAARQLGQPRTVFGDDPGCIVEAGPELSDFGGRVRRMLGSL
jgi:hypothetical protein